MPRKGTHHEAVVAALIHDGWTITDDPYTLSYQGNNVFVDLGAEKTLAATREGRRIAVEIKSFLHASEIHDLKLAIGSYVLYRELMEAVEPERELYLAIPQHTWDGLFSHPVGQLILKTQNLKVIVFTPQNQRITQWWA